MPEHTSDVPLPGGAADPKTLLGLTRARRFAFYRCLAAGSVVVSGIWMYAYLKPHRWYTYTDVVSFKQSAHDVQVGYVLWQPAEPLSDGVLPDDVVSEPCLSSDGTRLLYAKQGKDGSDDLFLRRWNGTTWSEPRAMRAQQQFRGNFAKSKW